MDIQDRIAARRKELAVEAARLQREIAAAELEQKIEDEREAATKAKAEAIAIAAEVDKRLRDQGLSSLATEGVVEKKVEAAVDAAISRAATSRMTSGENATFAVLVIVGLLSFAFAWPLAIVILFVAGWHVSKKTDKYKAQIIAEGRASQRQYLDESETLDARKD